MRTILLLLFALVAGAPGCSSSPTVEIPKEVQVAVPVACVPADQRPAPPALRSEADLMAMDRYRRTLAAWQDKRKLEIYMAQAEAIIEACSRIPR